MENAVKKASLKCFGEEPSEIKYLGGGFYGRAFRIKLSKDVEYAVVKLYLYPNLCKKEALQLETISRHSYLKVPKIYNVFEAKEIDSGYDVLLMEYIEGVNASDVDPLLLSNKEREEICESIVDNLISLHSVRSERGFGDLDSLKLYPTWQEYYYPIAESIVNKARVLFEAGQLSEYIMDVFKSSLECFNAIFSYPITKAGLVHGDYNTWNIMLTKDKKHALAVIDPFNCRFADTEIDLYQLDNANGKGYGLLDKYKEKVKLSENFEIKRSFYELYSEVCHYHDAHVVADTAAIDRLARRLREQMGLLK